MNRQLEAIRKFLKEEDLSFFEPVNGKHKERQVISLVMNRDVARWHVWISIVNEKVLLVHSHVGFNVPKGRRQAVAELITRANFGLLVGGWDMDMNDGEIRYRSSTPFDEGEVLPREVLRHTFYANLSTFERYFPAICKCAFGDDSVNVKELVNQTENREELSSELKSILEHTEEDSNGEEDSAPAPESGPAGEEPADPRERLRKARQEARERRRKNQRSEEVTPEPAEPVPVPEASPDPEE